MNITESLELTRYIKDNKDTSGKTWREFTEFVNDKFGCELSMDAVRSRYKKEVKSLDEVNIETLDTEKEFETHYSNGEIILNKKAYFDKDVIKDERTILESLGYNPDEVQLVEWRFGTWQVAMKDNDGEPTKTECCTIRAKIKPIIKDGLDLKKSLEVAKQVFSESIVPLQKKFIKNDGLDDNKLLELTGIELHLGKMAWSGDTGQDYDKNIAEERFYNILGEVVEQQEVEKCGNALICIGNDFFNSDTVNATTTKGTPQTNDLRWKKMFGIGLKMYTELFETLQPKFNKIEVRLQSGNHDKMSSFYLYMALMMYFKDIDNINFSENYQDVQCFKFGKCGIFFSHGDANLKRMIKSIPCEFYEEWGQTIFRELHLGHFHKEFVVDDDSGMITRRVGSPTGTDQWHYEERFIGATQKYQTFVWDIDKGLQNIKYINFEPQKKNKQLIKKKR